MEVDFKAKIYKVGINACVDVPESVTNSMEPTKGYIKVKGTINGFGFTKTLVPVKNGPYRLFVNIPMLKGGKVAVSETASFSVQQDFEAVKEEYPMPDALYQKLKHHGLLGDFNNLTASRKKEILKYLNYIKTEETLQKNINKLTQKMLNKERNIRIP